jgi:hypothetical protein
MKTDRKTKLTNPKLSRRQFIGGAAATSAT